MGGGFCDRHGPYDPPHTSCPFCAQEAALRRAFGPPPDSVPEFTRVSTPPDHAAPTQDHADEADFLRQTIEQVDDEPAGADVGHEAPPDHDQPPDLPPPTEDDLTRIAPSQIVDENVIEDPSWIEQEPEPLGWLIVKWPPEQRGEVLPVRANQTIGRQGDVRWPDPRLSRQHARLTFEPVEDGTLVFHLWPFGPTNPVAVNDQMIRGATPIYENDEIHLGDTLFVFKVLLD